MKHHVTIGVLLCLSGLILLNRGLIFYGLPAFLLGFYIMNKGKWRR